MENPKYLNSQLITYIGNKRKLLDFIEVPLNDIKKDLNKSKLNILDGFSGSGVVSRFLKKHSNNLYVNDLEDYCEIINKCYLSNISDLNIKEIKQYIEHLNNIKLNDKEGGIIREYYSPKDDKNIQINDRTFYTNENALIIDNIRKNIPIKNSFLYLAPLLYQASVHVNTSGVFKGFYKDKNTKLGKFGGTNSNALSRILKPINLPIPVFSNFECNIHIYKQDTLSLINQLNNLDVAYYDPPYNQHPYSSNYFMLNLIVKNKEPKNISKVSGIPKDWNKSNWNYPNKVKKEIDELIKNTFSKYILISYNNEGFLSIEDFNTILSKYGDVKLYKREYNVFRGGRILNRNNKVNELLFLLKKNSNYN